MEDRTVQTNVAELSNHITIEILRSFQRQLCNETKRYEILPLVQQQEKATQKAAVLQPKDGS